ADVLFLIGRRRRDHLHPRCDDAVLAAEETVADRLRVARGLRGSEVRLECGQLRRDGLFVREIHSVGLYTTKPRSHEATKNAFFKKRSSRAFVSSCLER